MTKERKVHKVRNGTDVSRMLINGQIEEGNILKFPNRQELVVGVCYMDTTQKQSLDCTTVYPDETQDPPLRMSLYAQNSKNNWSIPQRNIVFYDREEIQEFLNALKLRGFSKKSVEVAV